MGTQALPCRVRMWGRARQQGHRRGLIRPLAPTLRLYSAAPTTGRHPGTSVVLSFLPVVGSRNLLRQHVLAGQGRDVVVSTNAVTTAMPAPTTRSPSAA